MSSTDYRSVDELLAACDFLNDDDEITPEPPKTTSTSSSGHPEMERAQPLRQGSPLGELRKRSLEESAAPPSSPPRANHSNSHNNILNPHPPSVHSPHHGGNIVSPRIAVHTRGFSSNGETSQKEVNNFFISGIGHRVIFLSHDFSLLALAR
jgi:hypothetical protein